MQTTKIHIMGSRFYFCIGIAQTHGQGALKQREFYYPSWMWFVYEIDSEKRKLFWSIFQEMIIFYWESKVLVWQPAEELTIVQHGYRERIVQWVVSVSEIPPFHCSPFSNWWSWTRHSRIQNSNVRIQDHQNYERRSMKRRNLPYPRQLSC